MLKRFPSARPDPNTLNQEFYHELLYLMGLRGQAVGGVLHCIRPRCPEGERQPGPCWKNILYQMGIGHGLELVPPARLAAYGDDPARQREWPSPCAWSGSTACCFLSCWRGSSCATTRGPTPPISASSLPPACPTSTTS
ncbi:MAG: hypothetical protein WKG07_15845 [Hymenobacter sp.]